MSRAWVVSRVGRAAQGCGVLLDEVVGEPHEAARGSVVDELLDHGTTNNDFAVKQSSGREPTKKPGLVFECE